MQYFQMNQDKRVQNTIKFTDFPSDDHAVLLKEQVDDFNDITTLFVEGNKDEIYLDFIEYPVFLVSEELKKLLEMYDSTLIFKTVVLSNLKEQTQKIYWLVLTDIIEALSENTEVYKNGWVKEIVIDETKAKNNRVFQLKGQEKNGLYIELALAESILRRKFKGIKLQKVKTETREVI